MWKILLFVHNDADDAIIYVGELSPSHSSNNIKGLCKCLDGEVLVVNDALANFEKVYKHEQSVNAVGLDKLHIFPSGRLKCQHLFTFICLYKMNSWLFAPKGFAI